MLKKKKSGIEALRRRYGYAFVAHWIFGLVVFFIVPVLYSIIYSFSDVSLGEETLEITFVGLKNFSENLLKNPDYLDQIRDSVGSMFYSLPMVVSLSLILAVLLNQKYRGRAIMRVIFFLPVIIESSVIVRLLSDGSINSPIFNMSAQGSGVFDYAKILSNLNLPESLTAYFTFFLSNAVTLTWSCGIQIVLFLAGLQGIPESLYEVSKIEGANKWEEFWMITVPMLRHVLSLVIVYSMISMFTASNNKLMSQAMELMRSLYYGISSAMLWFYFLIVLSVIGGILLLYNKLCVKKWE